MSGHTPGPWSQGFTLLTSQTRRWSAEQLQANNERERRMVFAGFSPADQGCSRQLICVCEREEDARLIAAAPELLQALENLEVAMNTVNYVWDKRPENMWKAMQRVDADLKAARAAIAKAKGEA